MVHEREREWVTLGWGRERRSTTKKKMRVKRERELFGWLEKEKNLDLLFCRFRKP